MAARHGMDGLHIDAAPALSVVMAEGAPAWIAAELILAVRVGLADGVAKRDVAKDAADLPA